jgi:predicted ester cyclase
MSVDGKALVRQWFDDIFNRRDFEVCDDVIAPIYIERALAPFGQQEPGRVPGPEHVRRIVQWLIDQFPDFHFEIEDLVGEGDRVVCRVRSTGTNTGPLNGVMPPTGRRFDAQQMHWFRIENGRLAEHWATRDDLTTMLQLGVLARPGPPEG